MKYIKPELDVKNINVNETIASLNDWLVNNSLGTGSEGITTYIVNS